MRPVIDLGTNLQPVRVTNSGYVLCTDGGSTQRWHNGQLETLGGSEPYGYDINEAGTVVGYVDSWNYTSLSGNDFFSSQNGVFLATRWDAGETAPVNINPTSFAYHFENAQPNGQPPQVFEGTLAGSIASVIDNDGHIYGSALGGYQQRDFYTDADGNIHRRIWGYWGGGWDFNSGALGTISFSLSGEAYVFSGRDKVIERARNGTTIGYQSGPAGELYYGGPHPPGYTFIGIGDAPHLVNDQVVNFNPVNLNSNGELLCRNLSSQPFDWFLYDTLTGQVTRELEILAPVSQFIGPHLYPLALNHRQIPAYDQNGQPIFDGSGQQTTVESPQVLGVDGGFSEPILWEENSKTHHYQQQYLNRLINPRSGWNLWDSYDINDGEIISSDGYLQAYDAQGNQVGNPQWKSALLVPIAITPNPLPTSGLARAKIAFGRAFDIPTLPVDSSIDIKIGGQPVTDIHQDQNDAHIIYFTPPAAPLDSDGQPREGDCDVEITGIDPPPLGLAPLILSRFVHYTADSVDGMKSFSDSNVVVTEEASSYVDYQKRNAAISDDDALGLLGNIRETVAPLQTALFGAFFEQKEIDAASLQSLQSKASAENAKAIGKYVPLSSGAMGGIPIGVTIYADVPDAWEDGPTPAELVICRPTSDASPLTVQYTVSGSAQAGTDYTELTGSAEIPANATCVPIAVIPIQHALGGTDKTLILRLVPVATYQIGAPDTATITIHDFN